MLEGKILITGGSGFLGRAILRRAQRDSWTAQFTVYSRDELKQAQCRRRYKDARYVLGDVRDTERLSLVAAGHDIIVHTAALKYVPEGEHNVSECISVNVGGTQSVISAARVVEVPRVVVISTDKAVAPSNVYGMTKALCERLVGETADYDSGTVVTAVRYGNVIGSTGSVVPEFERQARECGVVNVTDPDMTRFWMTADEAIDLVSLASQEERGAIAIGKPMSMELGNLVAAVAPKARINVVGLRPGEKLHETLLTETEALFTEYLIRERAYRLPAISKRVVRNEGPTSDYTSFFANYMNPDDFLAAVEDSHNI